MAKFGDFDAINTMESEVIIAALRNRVNELEAKLGDKIRELDDMRKTAQDILVAAGELLRQ